MSLIFEEHVFDPRPRFPFLVTTKCYPNLGDEQDVFTLILAHGNGFPSELWEPIIERIFATENAKPDGLRIREAWAIDAPNHGDAAALNVTLLKSGAYDHLFSWENYARTIHLVLAGLGTFTDAKNQPVRVDFTHRRLIGIGHSMGGVSLILSHTFYPVVRFDSLVLVEPMLVAARHFKGANRGSGLDDIDEYISTPVKEDTHKNAFKGKAASIQKVAKGGHLVPQVQPDGVAEAILNTFSSLSAPFMKSRL